MYWGIVNNVKIQEVKYKFKVQEGRSPTVSEIEEIMNPPKLGNTVAVNTIAAASEQITSFL